MIKFLPEIYPDEAIYSYLSRCFARSGFIWNSGFAKEVFGKALVNIDYSFPRAFAPEFRQLIEDKIGVELKAVSEIVGEFEAQIINYLHVSNHKLGLLLNFGTTRLEYKWYPNEWHHRQCASIG